jgi:triphosphoribosyl-dephospho-CoA synthase
MAANPQNLGAMVQLACIWEASARKAGNVHRFAEFDDLHYLDFLASAAAIGPVLEKAWHRPVGEIVLDAVKATRQVVRTNSNLGIILLLTPLAAVVPGRPLRSELPRILGELTVVDAVLVYEAIRTVQPGGMGRVKDQDVTEIPTVTLRQAMALAEDRDRIARQYTHDFDDVFDIGVSTLQRELTTGQPLEAAIRKTHLSFMAAFPDSLIERKFGRDVAAEVKNRAAAVLADPAGFDAFDAWLRIQRYNPGTSADLVAASLFAAMREGIMTLPWTGAWS